MAHKPRKLHLGGFRDPALPRAPCLHEHCRCAGSGHCHPTRVFYRTHGPGEALGGRSGGGRQGITDLWTAALPRVAVGSGTQGDCRCHRTRAPRDTSPPRRRVYRGRPNRPANPRRRAGPRYDRMASVVESRDPPRTPADCRRASKRRVAGSGHRHAHRLCGSWGSGLRHHPGHTASTL